VNYGAFTARFILKYTLAGYEEVYTSEAFTMNQKKTFIIPGIATSVFVNVQVLYFISNWGAVYSNFIGASDNLCLALRGTVFYPTIQNC
jgi:hypothetical protein